MDTVAMPMPGVLVGTTAMGGEVYTIVGVGSEVWTTKMTRARDWSPRDPSRDSYTVARKLRVLDVVGTIVSPVYATVASSLKTWNPWEFERGRYLASPEHDALTVHAPAARSRTKVVIASPVPSVTAQAVWLPSANVIVFPET